MVIHNFNMQTRVQPNKGQRYHQNPELIVIFLMSLCIYIRPFDLHANARSDTTNPYLRT